MIIFSQVAERSSFARAGSALGMSTSAVSQRISLLEQRLGVRLLNRTTRSVSATPAGRRLLAELAPAIERFEHAVQSVNAFRNKPQGKVRISIPRLAVPYFTATFSRFLRAFPEVKLEVCNTDALVDIVHGNFDAGIRGFGKVDGDMAKILLGAPQKSVVVASPVYLAANPRILVPSDLKTHNCICHKPDERRGELRWRFDSPNGALDMRVRGSLVVNDSEIGIHAAIDGIGLAYSIESYVREFLDDGRLVALLGEWSWSFPGFFLFHSRGKVPTPALAALIDFLKQDLTTGLPRSKA